MGRLFVIDKETNIKNHKGFTLIECMLTSVLFSILLVILLRIFTISYQNEMKIFKEIIAVEEMRMVTAFLKEEVQEASVILLQKTGNKGSLQEPFDSYLVGLSLRSNSLGEKHLVLHLEDAKELFIRNVLYYQGVAVTQWPHAIVIKEDEEKGSIEVVTYLYEEDKEVYRLQQMMDIQNKRMIR